MKSTPKWFLIPPAIAAMLILGTLSMQGGGPAAKTDPRAAAPAGAGAPIEGDLQKNPRPAPALPRTPDLWQMSSALLGVLLLGTGAIMLLRRLRQGPGPKPGQNLIALRQTLRLSPRQAIHAIEFDERILLVGDSDKGLVLLEHGRLPDRIADEAEVLGRSPGVDTTVGDADDGAVPKNLVIPRPARPGAAAPATTAAPATAAPAVGLGDFRTLLKKAGRP